MNLMQLIIILDFLYVICIIKFCGCSIHWAIPFNKGTPPMDDRAFCLPWDKNFALTPLGQTVVYGELREIY